MLNIFWYYLPCRHPRLLSCGLQWVMDNRVFRAPIHCCLCSAVLNTLQAVSQHCDYHKSIDFQCQQCMIHYKSRATIAAHMNVKGAHLRAPFDPDSYFAAMPSPAPAYVSAAPQSIQCSPPPMVATLSEASIEQLLQDIDSSTTSGTDDWATSVLSLPNAQAAPPQPQSTSSLDVSLSLGAHPTASVAYPPAEYRDLRQQNVEQKFLLWWCLHHLKSLPIPPPSAGGELDMALRRVLQQTALAPQFDQHFSFDDIITKLHELHVHNVTKFT